MNVEIYTVLNPLCLCRDIEFTHYL